MKRSIEDTSESTRSTTDVEPLDKLLRHARRDGFTPKETEEVWSQLGAVLGAPGGAGVPDSQAGTSAFAARGVWSAKAFAVLALGSVVAVGGLAALGLSGSRAGAGDDRSPSAVESSAVASPGTDAGAEVGLAVGSSLPPVRSPPSSAPTKDSTSRSLEARRPSLKAERARASVSAVDTSAENTEALRAAARTSPSARQPPAGIGAIGTSAEPAVAVGGSSGGPAWSPADAMLNEGALLLRARRELGSNPTETLKLADQHSRLFPAGTLVPEREVLAIEALAKLGRHSEARARLADFRARFPQSPHLSRLDGILDR